MMIETKLEKKVKQFASKVSNQCIKFVDFMMNSILFLIHKQKQQEAICNHNNKDYPK